VKDKKKTEQRRREIIMKTDVNRTGNRSNIWKYTARLLAQLQLHVLSLIEHSP